MSAASFSSFPESGSGALDTAPAPAGPVRPLLVLLALTLLAAGAGSVLLLPTPLERSLIALERGDPTEARALLASELRGTPRPGEVAALVDLALALAEPGRAVALLERFLAAHPDHVPALRRLTEVLEDAHRPRELAAALMRLHAVTGEAEPLERAAAVWASGSAGDAGSAAGRRAALERLWALGLAEDAHLIQLAHARIADGDAAGALAVLAGRLAQVPSDEPMPADLLGLAAVLLPRLPDPAAGAVRLAGLLGRGSDPAGAVRLVARVLAERGALPLALDVFAALDADLPGRPDVALALAEAEMGGGRDLAARARLRALRDDSRLHDEAVPALVELELRDGQAEAAFALAGRLTMATMPGWLPDRLLAFAGQAGRIALMARAEPAALAVSPAAAAVAALARGDRAAAVAWAEAAVAHPPAAAPDATGALADALAALGRDEAAFARLVAGADRPEPGQLALLLRLAAAPGRGARALPVLARLRDRSPEAGAAWALMAAGQPPPGAVAAWLRDGGAPGAPALLDLLGLAAQRRDAALADAAAVRLADLPLPPDRGRAEVEALALAARGPLPMRRRHALLDAMADAAADAGSRARLAALLAGQPEPLLDAPQPSHPAVPLLRVDVAAGADRAAHLTVLAALAPAAAAEVLAGPAVADPRGFGPLHALALARAGGAEAALPALRVLLPRLPAPEREAALHRLHAALPGAAGLPVLRLAAETQGGAWAFAYPEALEKLGRRGELVAHLRARAGMVDLPRAERAGLAWRLATLGERDAAGLVLRDLAAGQAPGSEAVRALIHHWGPRAEPEAVAWTRARARAAEPAQAGAWLGHLDYLGAPEAVAEAVEARPALLSGTPGAAETYAAALRRLGTPARGKPALEGALEGAVPGALPGLARAAEALALPVLAHRAAERAVASRADAAGLLLAARAATAARRPGDAARHYAALLALGPREPDVLLDAAEAFQARERKAEARGAFAAALDALPPTGDRAGLRARARALRGLGRAEEAVALLERLLADGPVTAGLRADLLESRLALRR